MRRTRNYKSVCGCDEEEAECTGTTNEPYLIIKTWATLNVHARVRTDARTKEKRDEMT